MLLTVVNCEHFDRPTRLCRIVDPFDYRDCQTCSKRVAIKQPYSFIWTEADVDEVAAPVVEPDPNYTLCLDRISEEWPREWQAKIRAAAIGRRGRALLIPRVFYEEALKYRK